MDMDPTGIEKSIKVKEDGSQLWWHLPMVVSLQVLRIIELKYGV